MSTPNTHVLRSELHSYLNEFCLQEKFCDVVVKVEDRTFPCHRIVLASRMKYFRKMFSGQYNETEKKEIELKGVRADDFELLITHIYDGTVSFNAESAYRLMKISHYLNVQSLEDLCVDYLVKEADTETIPLSTAVNIAILASNLEKAVLVDKFLKWMAENFSTVTKFENFIRISGPDLLKILRHPSMERNLMPTLNFLVDWADFHQPDADDGKLLILDLIEAVNLEKEQMKEWFAKILPLRNKYIENIDKSMSISDTEDLSNPNAAYIDDEKKTGEYFFLDVDIKENDISVDRRKTPQLPLVFVCYDSSGSSAHFHFYDLNNCNKVRSINKPEGTGSDYSYNSTSTSSIYFHKSILSKGTHLGITEYYSNNGHFYYEPSIFREFKLCQRLSTFENLFAECV